MEKHGETLRKILVENQQERKKQFEELDNKYGDIIYNMYIEGKSLDDIIEASDNKIGSRRLYHILIKRVPGKEQEVRDFAFGRSC